MRKQGRSGLEEGCVTSSRTILEVVCTLVTRVGG